MSDLPPPLVPERSAPSMLAYSLLFALVYFVCAFGIGLLLTTFSPNRQGSMSWLGHVLVAVAALTPGWVFVKRHKRLFTTAENRRIVTFCIGWLFLFEGLALLGMADKLASLPVSWFGGILVFSLGFDALIVWIIFKRVVTKMMLKHVPSSTTTAV